MSQYKNLQGSWQPDIEAVAETVAVWTRDSFYTFDMDAGTVTRSPGSGAAPHAGISNKPLKLAGLHHIAVGEHMDISVDVPQGHNYPIRTSRVSRIVVTQEIAGYVR